MAKPLICMTCQQTFTDTGSLRQIPMGNTVAYGCPTDGTLLVPVAIEDSVAKGETVRVDESLKK